MLTESLQKTMSFCLFVSFSYANIFLLFVRKKGEMFAGENLLNKKFYFCIFLQKKVMWQGYSKLSMVVFNTRVLGLCYALF